MKLFKCYKLDMVLLALPYFSLFKVTSAINDYAYVSNNDSMF